MTRFGLWQVIGVGALAAGLSVATPDAARAQGAAGAEVTFSKDVAPIFQAKCQVCHRPGSIGPMSLLTYDDARPWSRSIRTRVAARDMPPWHLDKTVGIQHFINDASLTDQQIDTIVRWVDAGAPRGNPADLPPPVEWPNEDQFRLERVLGPPDLVIKSKPWTMPAQAQDTHFRPQADIPLTKGRWVRAAETKPSVKGRRIAHHSSTYLIRPEGPEAVEAERAMRAGQPGAELALANAQGRGANDNPFGNRELFTEWAQGKDGEIYPPNVGKLVMPGSKVEFDTHYHAVGEEITDELEIAWWFYPEDYTPKFSSEWMATRGGPRAADPAEHGHPAPGLVRAAGAGDAAQLPAAHALPRQGLHDGGDPARWPPRGGELRRPLHQHVAHQLHLSSGPRSGIPEGNGAADHSVARQHRG